MTSKHLAGMERQLTLFELPPRLQQYSHTIDLYDAMPKFYWGRPTFENGRLKTIVRVFEHKGSKFTLTIRPARIEDENGEERDYYPGKLEELVEDILRKFAADQAGYVEAGTGQVGVRFTLYQVQKELKRCGYQYAIWQIKRAIEVMASTITELVTTEGDTAINIQSTLFGPKYLVTKGDWMEKPKEARCFIVFHPLVTRSIAKASFRLVNYETCMSYRLTLARLMHKRMSHNFTQASEGRAYTIGVGRLISEAGLRGRGSAGKSFSDHVLPALEEMKEKGAVSHWECEKRGTEVFVSIHPSAQFVKEAKEANFHKMVVEEKLAKEADGQPRLTKQNL